MADCTVPVGSKAKAAIKASPSWTDPLSTLGAGDAIPLVTGDLEREPENVDPESQVGTVWQTHPVRVGEDVPASLELEGDYRRYMVNLACAMGLAGVPVEVDVGVSYRHTLNMDQELCGIVAALGIDKVLDRSSGNNASGHIARAKANGFTVSAQRGRIVRMTFPYLCRDYTEDNDTDGWTYKYDVDNAWRFLLPTQAVFRFNAQGAIALDTTDVILKPANWEVMYEANLEGEKVQDTQIDEPIKQQKSSVKYRLTFSAPNAAIYELFADAYSAQTILKGDLVMTDPLVLGTGNRTLEFYFPSLSVERVTNPIRDSGRINFTVEMHAAGSDTTVAGMAFSAPLQIQAVNEWATDPLATA